MSEKEIQKQIIDYLQILEDRGELYFIRSNSGAVKTQRKNGSFGFMKTGKAGCPDIIICNNFGKFIGVEVKTRIGKMSAIQADTAINIEKLGGTYILVRSLAELIEDLEFLKNQSKKVYVSN
jgi:hypothetical protein